MRLSSNKFLTAILLPATVVAGLVLAAGPAAANVRLTEISADPFTDAQAQHRTEVEPDTFAFGNTIVSAFQVGRVFGGGSSDIGFATSNNGGRTWTHGFLPATTGNSGGPCGQISDAAVAFDLRHQVWLISSLGVNCPGTPVFTSRSTDGGHTWSAPITTATGSNDKNWIVCDNSIFSRTFGHCYTEYDITSARDAIRMTTSADGGLTWGPAMAPADAPTGLGGQPLVQLNGTVVVPYRSLNGQIRSFSSTDGGASWNASVLVSVVSHHPVAGGLRSGSFLPSAETDLFGRIYLVWSDCRFRTGCPGNDIVLSTSDDGTTWTAPSRVPIDATTGTADHFVPGIGVDPLSFGNHARIGLAYYFYPSADCTAATCRLSAGFISSTNGGASWSTATQVAGPMSLSWLPNTSQGRMFGDYISSSVRPFGNAFPVFPVAKAPAGTTFDLTMNVPTRGLPVTGGHITAADTPAGLSPANEAPAIPTAF
jgi:hypothetical protein